MTGFYASFDVADKVIIDGHKDMLGVVTGVQFAANGVLIRVAWINSGSNHEVWMEEFRLTPA